MGNNAAFSSARRFWPARVKHDFPSYDPANRALPLNFKVPRPTQADARLTQTQQQQQNPIHPLAAHAQALKKKRKAAEDKAAAQTRKRRKIINELLDSVDTTETETKVSEGHRKYVERQRVFSVAAHTAWNLYKYSDRLEDAASYITSRRSARQWNQESFLASSRVSS